jgi:hypothetical protein
VRASNLNLAVEYLGIWLALNLQDADKAAFGPREGMIHKDIIAGDVEFEFHDGGPIGRIAHAVEDDDQIETWMIGQGQEPSESNVDPRTR